MPDRSRTFFRAARQSRCGDGDFLPVRARCPAYCRTVTLAPLPTLNVKCTSAIKKAPGRTEFQRGILTRAADGQWTVRTTGDQVLEFFRR